MTSIVYSKNGVGIRLTNERWGYITDEHCELAGMRLEVLVEKRYRIPRRFFRGIWGNVWQHEKSLQENGLWSYIEKPSKMDLSSPRF